MRNIKPPRKRVALSIMVTRPQRDIIVAHAQQRGVSLSEFCYNLIMQGIEQRITMYSAERYLNILSKRPRSEFDPDA